MIDNLSSLETILTSVLTSLGLASPLVASAIRFLFSEYRKLRDAVDMVMVMDARMEELDARVKALGGGGSDDKIKTHLAIFRKNLKESFNRRDERIGMVEHRVDEVKLTLEKAPPIDNTVLKRLSALLARMDTLETNIQQAQKGIVTTETTAGTPTKKAVVDKLEVAAIEAEIGKLRRALLKISQKIGVDVSWELHEKKQPKQAYKQPSQELTEAELLQTEWDSLDPDLKEELFKKPPK